MNFALKIQPQDDQEDKAWYELEEVINKNYGLYYGLAKSITKSDAAAEDVLQDVRLKLLRIIRDGSGDNIRYPKPFIYKAVQNFALNFAQKRQFPLFDEDAQHKIESNDINLDELIDLRNVCTVTGRLLSDRGHQSLESNTKGALRLYASGFTYKEISKKLNRPIGTVMSRISVGRGIIRRALGPEMCDVFCG